jgi:hypothetical protein
MYSSVRNSRPEITGSQQRLEHVRITNLNSLPELTTHEIMLSLRDTCNPRRHEQRANGIVPEDGCGTLTRYLSIVISCPPKFLPSQASCFSPCTLLRKAERPQAGRIQLRWLLWLAGPFAKLNAYPAFSAHVIPSKAVNSQPIE